MVPSFLCAPETVHRTILHERNVKLSSLEVVGEVGREAATADGPHKLAEQARAIIGGRLDILIADAGVSKAATIEDFDNLFAINVRAPFFLVQQLLPIMSSGGGHARF